MKNKNQFLNFRIDSSLHAELHDVARACELSCSVIARKGLKLILEQLKQHQHSVWSFPLQGAHS